MRLGPRNFFAALLSLWLCSSGAPASEPDSLLRDYSLDELEKYRRRYTREISRLENERLQLRRQGIRDAELFLSRHPDSNIGDKVMIRLAELYYERAQDVFQRLMIEYDRLYARFDQGELSEPPREPKKDFSDALNTYAGLIERYPHSDLVDDAFYNIGFLLEEAALPDSAQAYYRKVLEEFPDSDLMPDVYLRIAEYYFNPPQNDLETAIRYYKRILGYHESARYDEALYRLGWCHYRRGEYSEAISYFTLLADDVYNSRSYDPLQKFTNPSLVDESIEYIALSFLEYGGPEGASEYLEEIGGRDYGIRILRRIGDAYLDEKEDYGNALTAFNLLLQNYPNNPTAPHVQRRIVRCYRRLEDRVMAFLARDLLFTRYREGGEWWAANPDPEVRKDAVELAKTALRDNISVLLNRGQESKDLNLFEQSVVESRKFLQAFPDDSTAPLIHWNMAFTLDTKLKRTEQAYEEYLKISNAYWNTKYQRFAAENAVALAHEAAVNAIRMAEQRAAADQEVTITQIREADDAVASFRERMRLQPTMLSPVEIRLAEAYDNFVRLFPHAEETPLFLANAGALYYTHNRFSEALKYFKTLLRHFPGSEEVNEARYAIMESYFGKGDFSSSEIVARRIIHSDAKEETLAKARRRLAESIFLSAELYAEAEQHLEAGMEYRRVVTEVPDARFADLALFNAGLQFDKASDYRRAVETYSLLTSAHPSSPYLYDALNNLSFDYVELKDYRNAALTYERIADVHPDPEQARDALYNSSLFFAEAEDWNDAIRINRAFIKRYPDDDEADDLAFEIAGFYRNLNELERAQTAYEEFVQFYPQSSRTVEALFRRAEYYRELGQRQNARREYERSLSKSVELGEAGIDRNDFYAAEAEFGLAMLKFEQFEEIEFRLPESQIARDTDRKRDLLLEIVRHLGNAASYGTSRLYEATYMIGITYQEFARTWVTQQLPDMEVTRRIVAQKEVNDAGIELYQRAADAHRNTITALKKLAEVQKEALLSEAAAQAADADTAAVIDTLALVAADSASREINRWTRRAMTSLTEVNHTVGEIGLKSARAVLNAPEPAGLGEYPLLVYRRQVIDVAVEPLILEALEAFQLNLREADSLGIKSQWVELSKAKWISSKNIVPSVSAKLALDGLGGVGRAFVPYDVLIYSGRDFEDLLDELAARADDIANLIDFSRENQRHAADRYVNTIVTADSLGIEKKYKKTSIDSMMISFLAFALQCDTLGADAGLRAERARSTFRESQDPLHEEGLFTFESTYFSLRDLKQRTLIEGHEAALELGIESRAADRVILELIRFDPAKYASLMDLEIDSTRIQADSTWLASKDFYQNWHQIGFDDSIWDRAEPVPGDSGEAIPAVWCYNLVVSPQDTSMQPAERAYFRKPFSVSGLPVQCLIQVIADNGYNLFFNGDSVLEEGGPAGGYTDLSKQLNKGLNLVAIEAVDSDGIAGGIRVLILLKTLPGWDEKLKAVQPELAGEPDDAGRGP